MENQGSPVAYANLSASDVVTYEPCFLLAILLTSDAVGASDITLYEGTSSSGREVTPFKSPVSASEGFHFPGDGIPCDYGLYIEVGSNVSKVVVFFRARSH